MHARVRGMALLGPPRRTTQTKYVYSPFHLDPPPQLICVHLFTFTLPQLISSSVQFHLATAHIFHLFPFTLPQLIFSNVHLGHTTV